MRRIAVPYHGEPERFQAHSVVAAHRPGDMHPRLVAWHDLDDPNKHESPLLAEALSKQRKSLHDTAELRELLALLEIQGVEGLVVINTEVLILVYRDEPPVEPIVFAGAGASHAIPYHTLVRGLQTAAEMLQLSQRCLDQALASATAAEARVINKAMAKLQATGYARAGCDESDGNVVHMFEVDGHVQALSELRLFGNADARPHILLRNDFDLAPARVRAPLLKAMVDAGRQSYRNAYIMTNVSHVLTVE